MSAMEILSTQDTSWPYFDSINFAAFYAVAPQPPSLNRASVTNAILRLSRAVVLGTDRTEGTDPLLRRSFDATPDTCACDRQRALGRRLYLKQGRLLTLLWTDRIRQVAARRPYSWTYVRRAQPARFPS